MSPSCMFIQTTADMATPWPLPLLQEVQYLIRFQTMCAPAFLNVVLQVCSSRHRKLSCGSLKALRNRVPVNQLLYEG